VLEGIADAVSMLYLNRDRTGLIFDPDTAFKCPVGEKNPYTRLLRYGCNSNSFGYWDADATTYWKPPTDRDSTPESGATPFSPHRRGTITSGALFHWNRRFVDGGRLKELPAHYIFIAESPLLRRFADERDFLRYIGYAVRAQPGTQPRYAKHAQLAFASKNVFTRPNLGGGDIPALAQVDRIQCDDATCTERQALGVTLRTMSVDAPLRWRAARDAPPEFEIFAPTGNRYELSVRRPRVENVVYLEFSASPTFDSLIATQRVSLRVAPTADNNPPGYTRTTLPSAVWGAVLDRVSAGANLYYRVRQCVPQGDGTAVCPATSVATRPLHSQYIELLQANGGACNGSCAVPSSTEGGGWAGVAIGTLVATLFVRRRRR